jgi:alpha-L-fucosidase
MKGGARPPLFPWGTRLVYEQSPIMRSLLRRHFSPRLLFLTLFVAVAACGDGSSNNDAAEPTLCGVETGGAAAAAPLEPSAVPAWYEDAKLGIMVHWGVWTIPGWAETTLDPERVGDPNDPLYLLAPGGIENFLRHNPYSEWYENSLALDGTATRDFHADTYGVDFPYTGFQPLFEEQEALWKPEDWARLFAAAQARYVVLVTKHHDGYTLWPSAVENSHRPQWSSRRDVVGELAAAVRERCLRMGLYYSGGIDWSFQQPPIADALGFLLALPSGEDYARYMEAQYRELIERVGPSVLWNDITAPATADLDALFADYLAAVPDGIVNDRWGRDPATLPPHFRSVEYDVRDEIAADKWEAVRGIGRTFGYNRNQTIEQYGTAEQYIHLLIDVVSKNGNLLLNVGPMADGTIPAPQVDILRALGDWLGLYGEAIFATRPWTRFAGTTDQGIPVRFTRSADGRIVYAILLGAAPAPTITLQEFPESAAAVRLVGSGETLAWERVGNALRVRLPRTLPRQPAHAIAIALQ